LVHDAAALRGAALRREAVALAGAHARQDAIVPSGARVVRDGADATGGIGPPKPAGVPGVVAVG